MPLTTRDAATALRDGQTRTIDVGKVAFVSPEIDPVSWSIESWSTVLWPSAKWIGASMCVPPCSEAR